MNVLLLLTLLGLILSNPTLAEIEIIPDEDLVSSNVLESDSNDDDIPIALPLLSIQELESTNNLDIGSQPSSELPPLSLCDINACDAQERSAAAIDKLKAEMHDTIPGIVSSVSDNKNELGKLLARMRIMEQNVLSNSQPVLQVSKLLKTQELYYEPYDRYQHNPKYRDVTPKCENNPCQCSLDVKQVVCFRLHLRKVPNTQIVPDNTENLDFSHNLLEALHRDTFSKLPNLTKLHLHNNRFTGFTDGLFDAQTNLQELTLNLNMLEFLPSTLFVKTSKLAQLNLSNNKLTYLHDNLFEKTASLKVLDLSNNEIQFLSVSLLKNLRSLTKLDLHNNELTRQHPLIFNNLNSLQNLNIANNPNFGVSIPDEIFGSPKTLQHLNLKQTGLTKISSSLLSRNHDLTKLELDNNAIIEIEDNAFVMQKSLTELNLSMNRISIIHLKTFAGLASLQSLGLQNNALEEIEANAFDDFNSIITLDLSDNLIKAIPPKLFRHLTTLQKLNLQNNQIEVVEPAALNGLFQTKQIYLGDNPYYCNCSMSYFSIWLMSNEGKVQQPQPICSMPTELQGTAVADVASSLPCRWSMKRR